MRNRKKKVEGKRNHILRRKIVFKIEKSGVNGLDTVLLSLYKAVIRNVNYVEKGVRCEHH